MSNAEKVIPKNTAEYSELLSKLQDIPTLPVVATAVNQLINDPNSSSSDIANLLKKDQVMTAKILRLVNSSYYSIPGGVTDVQRALAFLGFNTLAQLVLGLSVFSLFTKKDNPNFSLMDFWKHALGTAVCAELLAKRLKIPRPEEAFTCGLLHDIGKLVLHEIDAPRLNQVVNIAAKKQCSFVDVERELDIPGHAYLGEIIATKWGLPQVIRLAIRYHHFDVTNMESVLQSAKPIIQVVRLANTLCVKNKVGNSGDCSDGIILDDMIRPLKIPRSDIPQIEEQAKAEIDKAGAFLSAYT
jgi:putative nucleotidyltransferase with HDIG domain